MLGDIEKGKIAAIITKDLSRLGRDYLKTGFYIECFFPEHKIRFIAVNDNVDTDKENNEFTPFRNIINEWYAKDISKKIKSAYRTKALKGEFTGPYAPYGYKKNPDDKHKLIIDEEAAPVVRRIFELAKSGETIYRIGQILKKDGVLKPRAKMVKDLGKYTSEKFLRYPCDWRQETIKSILRNREYLGHIVCNKNTSKSFKDRRLVAIPENEWIEVKNMHEPIIDEDTFELAQRATKKYRVVKDIGEKQLEKRATDLDIIIQKLFESNALGVINNERFSTMLKTYEDEQQTIRDNLKTLNEKSVNFKEKNDNLEKFTTAIKKFVDIQELNSEILNELIDKIVIHERKFIDNQEHRGCRENRHLRIQQIDIHYKFVGIL